MPITFPFWMGKFILCPNRCQSFDHPPTPLIASNSLARRFACAPKVPGFPPQKALALTEDGVLPLEFTNTLIVRYTFSDVYRVSKDQRSRFFMVATDAGR